MNPGSRNRLREDFLSLLKQIDTNASPMVDLTIKAIEEDWDEEKLTSETVRLIKEKQIDLRKNFDYYADAMMSLVDEYLESKKD